MDRASLGACGLKVSRICLGTMLFGSSCDEPTSRVIMDTAFELGIDFFDVANSYPSPPDPLTMGRTEEIVGRWLKGRRDAIILSTKFGSHFQARKGSRRDVILACEASLGRLGTDWIDVYWFHQATLDTAPFEESLEGLDRLVQAGKVLYVGASNFEAWQLGLLLLGAADRGGLRPIAVQPRYNLLHREPERDLIPLAVGAGLGVVPFNPLGGGLLTGKYARSSDPPPGSRFSWGAFGRAYAARYWSDAAFDLVEVVRTIAGREALTPSQVAISWLLSRTGVTSAIVGASQPQHLRESSRAVAASLSADAMAELDQASQGFH
jgi:aryl-alcohol dehydrogenase-like predicted oxidoreductase